ncbi:MAG: 50S ribosomal protein L35 [Pseudomonadales bacterium]|jgi:large subunit ribosomal protein L35|nr:50S ribosomal protein L35 [Pseudomonadales bacterium]
MPKIKSNKGALKRFRKRANGFKRRSAYRNHILTKKATKRKRHLRGMSPVHDADVQLIKRMLPQHRT